MSSSDESNESSIIESPISSAIFLIGTATGSCKAKVLEDAELLHALYAKLNELDPEGRLICQLIMQGKSERDCGKEMGLSRNTFVYRRDKLFKKLRSELKDYI